MKHLPPSLERLREVLAYQPETGVFTWKNPPSRRTKAGSLAGSVSPSLGYVLISIDYSRLYAHRLAWLYVHGEWPKKQIDHINGVKTDNRIDNLRLATCSQNFANKAIQANNTSGTKGVFDCGDGRWLARIGVGGKHIHLGSFPTKELAAAAYMGAAKAVYGDFARAA